MSWFGDNDKVRKSDWPVWDYLFDYFPLAFLEEVRVAVLGNRQHNPDAKKIIWSREKSTDQLNTAMRHQVDYAKAKREGVTNPRDATGKSVLAQAIWRLKAQLQLDCEAEAKEKDGAHIFGAPSIPAIGCRDNTQPIPPDKIVKHCQCGARLFTYNDGDAPPNVIDPRGKSHSLYRCGDV